MDKFFMVIVAFIFSVLVVSIGNFKNNSQAHVIESMKVMLGHGKTIKAQRSPAIVYKKR